ncbi:hypothetical protein DTO271G3_6470 [Paecilomyces variotii]|nr:hypothetical protein DTO271G3_6470 [Paecilomyces variotii]
MFLVPGYLTALQTSSYGLSDHERNTLHPRDSQTDIKEVSESSSTSTSIFICERGESIFSIPQTLATVIPPTTSSETTSTSKETRSWYTTTFFTTFPTGTATQSDSTITSSNPTATTSSTTPTETQAQGTKTSKAPTVIIVIISILVVTLCCLLLAIWFFRKKRKRFYSKRGKERLPDINTPRTRSAGSFGLRGPMRDIRNSGGNDTPTSLVKRILPHSLFSRKRDLGCPCPQPPDDNARYGPNSSPLNEQFPLKETRGPATPSKQQRVPASKLHDEMGDAGEFGQVEHHQSGNGVNNEIESIIDRYAEIPDHEYASPTGQGVERWSQGYASPESSAARMEMVERPRSEPLFFKLHNSGSPGWKRLSPVMPLTPSTGLRTEDCDTPLFPRMATLRADNGQQQEQSMRNDPGERGKDNPRYYSDQTTDPEYESRKRDLQRRFGFGEQFFPSRSRNSASPSYGGPSRDVSTMHGWGTFANNDPRWEERTEKASSGLNSGNRLGSQDTPHSEDYDPNNVIERQESRSHSITSLHPRPLVIRKVNSLPLLESILSELGSSSEAAWSDSRASRLHNEQLEYLPATRYDPAEDRALYDVRGSYGSDETIREIHSTIEGFNNMEGISQDDIEETRSYYEYGNFESHGDRSQSHLTPYRHMNPGEPSTRTDPSPNSSRLSQVDLGSVSGSLRMSGRRSSIRTHLPRQRSEETLISDDLFGPKVRAMRAGREYVLAASGRIKPSAGAADQYGDSRDNARNLPLRRDIKGKMPERGQYNS